MHWRECPLLFGPAQRSDPKVQGVHEGCDHPKHRRFCVQHGGCGGGRNSFRLIDVLDLGHVFLPGSRDVPKHRRQDRDDDARDRHKLLQARYDPRVIYAVGAHETDDGASNAGGGVEQFVQLLHSKALSVGAATDFQSPTLLFGTFLGFIYCVSQIFLEIALRSTSAIADQ